MRHDSEFGRGPTGVYVGPARKAEASGAAAPLTNPQTRDIPPPAPGAGVSPGPAPASRRPREPRVEVVSAAELDPGVERAWSALQAADPDLASPFFSARFCRIVGQVRDDTRIAVFSDASGPIGFFPYHRQRFGRLAPLAGQISDYHGIVGSDGGLGTATLLRALRAQAFDFNHAPASQRRFCDRAFLQATSPLVDLSHGYEAWRQERRAQGGAIRNAERKGRKLAREVGPLRFVANDPDPAVWHQLLAWKRASLQAMGVAFILDRPWAGEVIDRVRATDTPGFGGMTSALWAGDSLAAVTFSMRTDTTIHSWFPTYNPDLERYSPGLTLLMETLRHAAEAGFAEVDLGRGSERYKTEFANGARALCEGSIERGLSPLGVTRKLRKGVLALAQTSGKAGLVDLGLRAGNRLLSAGRIF